MAYARTRKHYRVAQKEIEEPSVEGFFIANEEKYIVIALLAAFMMLVFAKGLLIGALAARSQE